jgi:heptose-I-phosphate ethanolaminephosphotransferase
MDSTRLRKSLTTLIDAIPLMALFGILLCLPAAIAPYYSAPAGIVCLLRSFAVVVALAVACRRYKALRNVTAAILSLLLFVNMYCALQLHCVLSSSVVFLVLQTDAREAGEYLSEYLLTRATFVSLAVTILITTLGLLADNVWRKKLGSRIEGITDKISTRMARAIMAAVGALTALSLLNTFVPTFHALLFTAISCAAGILTPIAIERIRIARSARWIASVLLIVLSTYPYCLPIPLVSNLRDKKQNSLQGLTFAIADALDSEIDIDRLTDTNINATASTANRADYQLVIIIGESFNRMHSSLYGYRHDTNPRLRAEVDSGRLTVFADAHSPTQATGIAMRGMLSTHAWGDSLTMWEDYPLFPALLRKAGYSVALLDNQGTATQSDAWQFHSSSFFSTPRMSHLCFNSRNDSIFAYDHELTDNYLDRVSNSDVTIIHLMGQHCPARLRYPEEYQRFGAKDYAYRTDLDNEMRETIAAYDNATLYNDAVVSDIIDRYRGRRAVIIYLSDHGEPVYDGYKGYGRIENWNPPEYAEAVYHIPYMVWVSDLTRAEHPQLVTDIAAAAGSHINSMNLGHVVLDLMNVDTPWLRRDLSWKSTH